MDLQLMKRAQEKPVFKGFSLRANIREKVIRWMKTPKINSSGPAEALIISGGDTDKIR